MSLLWMKTKGLEVGECMASRLLHLAVVEELMKLIPVKDENRLRLGCILPDAYNPEAQNQNSHLKVHVDGDSRTTYDCDRFLSMFEKEMQEDDLYKGYYLHLIQDLIFRELVYDKYEWNPTISGNVGRLHNDYSLINSYIIKKYGIKNDIHLIENLKKEKLYSLYPFKAEEFLLNMEQDFQNLGKGDLFFFTESMADEFVAIATEECYKELLALKNGTHYVDTYERAWLRLNKLCSTQ